MEAFFVFLAIFLGLAILFEVPLAISIGMAATVTFITSGFSLTNLGQSAFYSLDNFDLLALPFFMFAGIMMKHSSLSGKLFNWINSFISRFRGSVGAVGVITCAAFGTLTGSLTSTVAAIGKIVFPEMEKRGYDRPYGAALVANSGMLGQLIPPSTIGIVYAMSSNRVSVSDVWLSTVGPAILIVAGYCIYNYFVRRKIEEKVTEPFIIPSYCLNIFRRTKQSFWAIMMPVIVFGGVYGGVFTPTEAGAISSVYAIIYYLIKKFKGSDEVTSNLPAISTEAISIVGSIMLIMALATAAGRAMSFAGISKSVAVFFETYVSSPWEFLLFNIILFTICGMIVDSNVAILLFIPLMEPLLDVYGINPIFFSALVILVLEIGAVTPPFCVAIYLAAKLTNVSFMDIMKKTVPFLIIDYIVLLVVIFFPVTTTFVVDLIR
jgi:C4-dicarboxylate transporter DctM subunit